MQTRFRSRRKNPQRFGASLFSKRPRRPVQRSRVNLAPEVLEQRVLLAFSSVDGLGGGAAAWNDFDKDGWTDVVSGGTLYRNNNGSLSSFAGGFNDGIWGDYDNDGWDDFFTHGGGLLRNEQGKSFTNVSSILPPLPTPQSNLGSSWGDFNGDGFLDLYIGNYERWPDAYFADNLLINNRGPDSNGDWFTLTWTQGNDAEVTGGRPRPARGVSTFDYDEDGDLDIYVSNYRLEPNALWQNDGQGNISDVSASKNARGGLAGGGLTGHTIGSALGDVDNDGHIDIFVGNFSHNWFAQPGGQFLRNTGPNGNYAFDLMVDWTYPSGEWQESYASASLADYDNDSDLDLYFTTVYGGDHARLYRNDGNWNFSNVTGGENLTGQPSTYQAAWADYDNDGDLDLMTSGTLYRNDNSNNNNWLKVDLIGDGVNVNTTAIGAIVRIDTGSQIITRQVETGTGQGNQNDSTLHFGLGSISSSVPVEVTWPDGTVRIVDAAPNQTVQIPYNLTALPEVEMGEVGIIASLTNSVRTINLNRIYENPVVFAQSASGNGGQPVVVRVDNVQANRFDIFLAEPSNEDGVHGAETVTYLVLEAGTHHLNNGAQLEVGTVNTTATVGGQLVNLWQTINFQSDFSNIPVVLSQIQTKSAAGQDYLNLRQLATSRSGVTLAMEQEEAVSSHHNTETVGYLAIDSGTGTWNDMAYEAVTTSVSVSENYSSVSFANTFQSTPSLLSSLSSYFGSDNANLRYNNLSSSGVEFKVSEDTTFDEELSHTAERASYLAIGGQGMLTALEPQTPVGEVGTVDDLTNTPRTVVLNQTYENPVVFAQSASANGGQPVVVRVTNVQSDRFDMYLAEPSNEDGTHGAEGVTYIVLEAGTHQLIDGTRVDVGSVETSSTVGRLVSNLWESVSFSSPFDEIPVVLSQIQTVNNTNVDFLKIRHLTTDSESVTLSLESEENSTAQLNAVEKVGYLAIESGSGVWGQMPFAAGTTTEVTDQFSDVEFSMFFSAQPAFLSSLGSYFGQDNAHVRWQIDSQSGKTQVKIDEDTSYDTELVHSNEDVNFLAIDGDGFLMASQPIVDIGEAGQIDDLTNTPRTVLLHGEYEDPVVFAQSASANGGQPVAVRVRNVQSDRFQIYLGEPSNEDGNHGAEMVSYLVLEAGVHQLHDGTRLEIGKITTDATVGHVLTNNVWETINFAGAFDSTPAVLSQVQTVAAGGARYLNTRHLSVSPTDVVLALEQEEMATTPHVAETIGYMAIDQGKGVWSGLAFEAFSSSNSYTDNLSNVEFQSFFNGAPVFLSNLTSYYGTNSANLRFANLTSGNVQLKVEEDTTLDAETAHGIGESITYLAIGGSGLITAVSLPIPPQVTAFVRDDAADTYDSLETLQYTFDKDVTITNDALQLTNDSNGGTAVDLNGAAFDYDSDSQTATWNLAGITPLPAAWYTATLDATQVTSASGLMLDGNGDGTEGDAYTQTLLVAKRGDANLNGYIDIGDFNTLVENYDPLGQTGSVDWSMADFDGDGDVDISDFSNLARNFSPLGYATAPGNLQTSPATSMNAVILDQGDAGGSVAAATTLDPVDISAAAKSNSIDRAFADLDSPHHELLWYDSDSIRRKARRTKA